MCISTTRPLLAEKNALKKKNVLRRICVHRDNNNNKLLWDSREWSKFFITEKFLVILFKVLYACLICLCKIWPHSYWCEYCLDHNCNSRKVSTSVLKALQHKDIERNVLHRLFPQVWLEHSDPMKKTWQSWNLCSYGILCSYCSSLQSAAVNADTRELTTFQEHLSQHVSPLEQHFSYCKFREKEKWSTVLEAGLRIPLFN